MHKAISTKVQGKTCFETKQQSWSNFLIFYFLCVFGFLTQKKKKKIDKNRQCKNF